MDIPRERPIINDQQNNAEENIMASAQEKALDFSTVAGDEKLEWSAWYDILYAFNVEFITAVLLTVLVSYILIRTPAKLYIKFLTIPLLFFLLYSTMDKLNDVLGYAYPTIPVGKVIVMDGARQGKVIELWVKHLGETDTRLYKMPYSRELQKKIKEGKKARQQGNPMVLEWKKSKSKQKGRSGQRNPGRFIVYNLRDLMEGPKKNYEQR